jgi:hypothetical protein
MLRDSEEYASATSTVLERAEPETGDACWTIRCASS